MWGKITAVVGLCPCCLVRPSVITLRTDRPIFPPLHFMGPVGEGESPLIAPFCFSPLSGGGGHLSPQRCQKPGAARPQHPEGLAGLKPSPPPPFLGLFPLGMPPGSPRGCRRTWDHGAAPAPSREPRVHCGGLEGSRQGADVPGGRASCWSPALPRRVQGCLLLPGNVPSYVPDETSYGLSKVWEGRRGTAGCFFVFLPLFSLCLMSWQGSATF